MTINVSKDHLKVYINIYIYTIVIWKNNDKICIKCPDEYKECKSNFSILNN